ncbi:hypothetical protein JCM19232_6108 [Vibrio ishigakensis]|uniref:Uncharacterized protein n=1 Tax=Vibrio ishigakensis TaxID=1481914 RepID=A0A0B8PFC7_9VIBR|nr:hypothetical protein JCM19232_6108 [Vibrio ishigakensis]
MDFINLKEGARAIALFSRFISVDIVKMLLQPTAELADRFCLLIKFPEIGVFSIPNSFIKG